MTISRLRRPGIFGKRASLPLAPMRMNKSGAQNGNAINTWVPVITWVADASFPLTDIFTDGIRVSGSSATADIGAAVAYPYEYATHQIRIKKNGVVIVTGNQTVYPGMGAGNSAGIVRATLSNTTVSNGDIITVEFWVTDTFSSTNNILAAGTYLQVSPTSTMVSAGILQTTNWEGNPNNTWYTIPSANWGASWATYPSTVKDGSGTGVVVSGSGLARIKLTTQTSSGTGNRMGRYKINGVANSEDTTMNSANPYVQTFDNVMLNNGDIVIPEYRNNGTITSQRTFSACSIEITPMPVPGT